MEVSMEDAAHSHQQQHQQHHGQQGQSPHEPQQLDGLQAFSSGGEPGPAFTAQDVLTAQVPQVTDCDSPLEHHQQAQQHPQQQQQQEQQEQQEQQQPQEQQEGNKRPSKGSKYLDPKDEGPNVDKWWLSESEGEGDDDEEQQMLAKSEDALYDPQADEADEAWAVQQRSGRTTDAILSCPGCFATLCIDCQQHDHYHTQYRAMFTQNCEVKLDQVLQTQLQRPQQQQHQRGRKRRADAAAVPQGVGVEEGDMLHPVCCAVCGTQVGAQDADEIVHFFQVLASEC